MDQLFARFDSSKPSPYPVIGWYDFGIVDYPNLVPDERSFLPLTKEEWAHRMDHHRWAVDNGKLVELPEVVHILSPETEYALAIREGTIIECSNFPEISGRYLLDSATMETFQNEMLVILYYTSFANGEWNETFVDADGNKHQFHVDHFQAFFKAIAAWQAEWRRYRLASASKPANIIRFSI